MAADDYNTQRDAGDAVGRRRTDVPGSKFAAMIIKNQWLLNLLLLFLLALGFGFETPQQKFDAVKTTTDSLSEQIGDLQKQTRLTAEMIEIIAVDVCLRRKDDAFAVLRLQCDRYLNVP